MRLFCRTKKICGSKKAVTDASIAVPVGISAHSAR